MPPEDSGAAGQPPESRRPSLTRRIDDALAAADAHLARGEVSDAARSCTTAFRIAFSRNVHFDALASPLAEDALQFSAPFATSATTRRLRGPRGRTRESNIKRSGPLRVTVLTRGNDNFLADLLGLLDSHPDATVEYLNLGSNKQFSRGIFKTPVVVEEILAGNQGMADRVEEVLRPVFERSDVLFVEWCSALAVLVGLVDPRDTRVIVRLHSYEAFTHWPHLLDFSRIDDLVFVSEHLRDLAVDAIPGLRESDVPHLHVVPLAKDLQPYSVPKVQSARFRLGMVGWGSVAKDPLWALDVLRRLRKRDDRYTLDLIGSDFKAEVSESAERYGTRLDEELSELEEVGAVRRRGQVDDVPRALEEVGVILSTSVRESFHAGLVEGVASGAVPVVRDWPFFAGRQTGARSLYPGEWIVDTPREAVQRILLITSSEETWKSCSEESRAHALGSWDWKVVQPRYADLFFGRRS